MVHRGDAIGNDVYSIVAFVIVRVVRSCWTGQDAHGDVFKDLNSLLASYDKLHALGIYGLVALGPGGTYGGTFADVKGFFLQGSEIGVEPHFATQGI